MMNTHADQKTYLVFWDVQGDPRTLEDILKVKADVRVSLGNLISDGFDEDDVRYSIYCIALAKHYNCQILKGENERIYSELKGFAHPMVQKELKDLVNQRQIGELVFLSRMPITPTNNDEKIIAEKLRRLDDRKAPTNEELKDIYGRIVSKNLDNLIYNFPKGDCFFVGRKECALWQRGSVAIPTTVSDLLGEHDSSYATIDAQKYSGYLVSLGQAIEGYYCTLTLPEKRLTFYST